MDLQKSISIKILLVELSGVSGWKKKKYQIVIDRLELDGRILAT